MAFVYGGWLRRSCGNLGGKKCILGMVVLPVHRARLGGYIVTHLPTLNGSPDDNGI
jgi:hypothetical protein